MEPWYANSSPVITDCRGSYSFFFDLIAPLFEGQSNPHPLHRLCSLMRKMGVTYLVQETLQSNPAISIEEMALARRLKKKINCRATRITFFRSQSEVIPMEISQVGRDYCLAYVTIVQAYASDKLISVYIFESVVHTPSRWRQGGSTEPLPNYYISMARKFDFVIGAFGASIALSVDGSFFCQQNTITNVCAHSALRMAINNSKDYENDKLLTAEDINTLLEYDHIKKYFAKRNHTDGYKGLEGAEIGQVARHFGYRTHGGEFKKTEDIDYQDVIYPIIESGRPLILGITCPKEAHVVTVLGHTRNSDRWMPEAIRSYGASPQKPYISTASWVDHFIINDDNYGIFVTLHSEGIGSHKASQANLLSANLVIGIMPKEVVAEGSLVEHRMAHIFPRIVKTITAATSLSPEAKRWIDRLGEELVCRTLLQTPDNYCRYWAEAKDQRGKQITDSALSEMKLILPPRFWVTELTLPQLYAGNKRKLGDVINTCEKLSPDDLAESILGIILPGVGLFKKDGKLHDQVWEISGHLPLIRGEWSRNSSGEW